MEEIITEEEYLRRQQIKSLTGMEHDVYELSGSEKLKIEVSKAIHKILHESKSKQYKLTGQYDDSYEPELEE